MLFLQNYRDALNDLLVSSSILGSVNPEIKGASSDSRKIAPGWLFCAVQGSKVDGHDYILQAIERGAVAVVVEKKVDLPQKIPVLRVSNGYQALGLIAECMYEMPSAKMHNIGITGTNGKTTCAYLLRDILRASHYSCGMIGTVQYDLGDGRILAADRTTPTPFELEEYLSEMQQYADYAVLEVSSHALAQERLGNMKFDGGIFTNLTQDHLDYHKTMDAYFACKRKMFAEKMCPSAPMVINADDAWGEHLTELLHGKNVLSIRRGSSLQKAARQECLILSESVSLNAGNSFVLRFPDEDWAFVSPLIGNYNLYNLACAICLARELGADYKNIYAAVQKSVGAPGRLQSCVAGKNFNVYVDYAHTDDAITKALQALRPFCKNKLRIVFGCGGDRDVTKRPRMGAAAAAAADILYVTSDNPRSEVPEQIIQNIVAGIPNNTVCVIIADRQKAIAKALEDVQCGDVILIAGKGHEKYQEINGVKHPFSDFQCVLDCFSD